MKIIFWGLALIAVGLVFGGSIFLGDYSVTSWIFDGLGILFIIIGLIQVLKRRQTTA